MRTQRRVVRLERAQGTEQTRAVSLTSFDEEGTALHQDFRRVIFGLTASNLSPRLRIQGMELATNSLSFSSSCHGRLGHESQDARCAGFVSKRRNGATGCLPASEEVRAGSRADSRLKLPVVALPGQLSLDSPLLAGSFSMHSALPQIPTGSRLGTERQYGQGNLYLQHAARNAACDIGRRSARGNLLRA